MPLLVGRNPRKFCEPWNQPTLTLTCETPAGCVAATTDRVGLEQTLLDEVIVEEADGDQPQLHGRVRQAHPRIDGDNVGSAPPWPRGKVVHIACDLTTICANRIDVAPFAKPQVIGQPRP